MSSFKSDLKNVGICIKTLDGVVESQNEKCSELCGNQIGKVCQTGCMRTSHPQSGNSSLTENYKALKNITTNGHLVDAVLVRDADHLTTIVFDKAAIVAQQLKLLEPYPLSKAEMGVIEKFLEGFSSHDIADQLCISHSTLRTHLNNIYKKIPKEVKNEILAAHTGHETREKLR